MATKNKKLFTQKIVIIGGIALILLTGIFLFFQIKSSQTVYPGVGEYDEQLGEEEFSANKEKEVYQYTLENGEEVTIRIPKGIAPPSLEVVEELRKNQEK